MRILFIDIDTLRPDHMGCYGYYRNTTPNIDSVAEEGVRFNKYYCSDAPCLPSRAALISGKFGIRNGAVGHGGTCADMRLSGKGRDFGDMNDRMNFNFLFRHAGLHTASISTFPERHSSWWFNAGFNETYNVGGCGGESGEKIYPVALDWLEKNKTKDDWFLHVHFWDPHTPYRAPKEFGNPFENSELKTWITPEIMEEHKKMTGPHGINEIGMYNDNEDPNYPRQPGKLKDIKDLKRLIDGYDCGVNYTDLCVGKIFDKLKELGLYEDTSIIVTSDHGENIGELGIYSEHGTADHNTCNIPMIIKWQGGVKNHVDDEFHYNIDLVPTMADLLNLKNESEWDGKTFVKTIKEGKAEGEEVLIISQMAHVCQRSARFSDWLYIRTYHDGFHLFDKEMLFNIKEDPREQNDLKEKYPEICAKGAKYILDWHDEMMLKSNSEIDPLWTVIREGGPYHARPCNLKPYIKRLEETGRSEGAERLKKEYHI